MIEEQFHPGFEAVNRDIGHVRPWLHELRTFLANQSVSFNTATARVEANDHDVPVVGIIGEPQAMLREKPVRVMGEI